MQRSSLMCGRNGNGCSGRCCFTVNVRSWLGCQAKPLDHSEELGPVQPRAPGGLGHIAPGGGEHGLAILALEPQSGIAI